jgi:hypothetical protein
MEHRPPLGPITNQKIWDVVWEQWEQRNKVVHRQEDLVTIEELEHINVWIREAFRLG